MGIEAQTPEAQALPGLAYGCYLTPGSIQMERQGQNDRFQGDFLLDAGSRDRSGQSEQRTARLVLERPIVREVEPELLAHLIAEPGRRVVFEDPRREQAEERLRVRNRVVALVVAAAQRDLRRRRVLDAQGEDVDVLPAWAADRAGGGVDAGVAETGGGGVEEALRVERHGELGARRPGEAEGGDGGGAELELDLPRGAEVRQVGIGVGRVPLEVLELRLGRIGEAEGERRVGLEVGADLKAVAHRAVGIDPRKEADEAARSGVAVRRGEADRVAGQGGAG